jgi:hypothetical protein
LLQQVDLVEYCDRQLYYDFWLTLQTMAIHV